MEDSQPGVSVPDLSRRLEGRVTREDAAKEATISGGSVSADLVSSGSSYSREEAEIPAAVLSASAGTTEEHR